MKGLFEQTGVFRPIEIAGTEYIRLTDLTQAIGYGKRKRAAQRITKGATVTGLSVHEGEIHATVTIAGAIAHAGEVYINEGLAMMILTGANTKEARNLKHKLKLSGNLDATDATNAYTDTTDAQPNPSDGNKRRKSYLTTIDGTDYISKTGLLHVLGVAPTTIQMMIDNHKLPNPIKHNNRYYWTVATIRDLINAGLSNNRTRKRYLPKLERFEALE